jgi:hypothetical protein
MPRTPACCGSPTRTCTTRGGADLVGSIGRSRVRGGETIDIERPDTAGAVLDV